MSRTRVAVIGGGIGGLAAALSFRAAGFDARVYEQSRALSEVGAGIQIAPNASRILHRLGLGPALDRRGVRPVAVHQRRWDDGRTLQRAPLGRELEAAFGAPYYHFHRADLLAALADALPAGWLHTGHRLTGIEHHDETVALSFANGESAEAEIVVGADGIHSTVRGLLFGPEAPRFTGCIAYRGLVPADRLRDLNMEVTSNNWMGPGRHFVHYFVAGATLVNFVAVVEQESWTRESWTDPGEVADALAAFAGWHPQVRSIIGAVDQTFKWALFDREALPLWSKGRVTLLGDACHAMLPFMAQVPARRSRTAPRWRPASRWRIATFRRRCSATRACAGRAQHGCRSCRAPTRRAFICRTGLSSRRAMRPWLLPAIGRLRRWPGSMPTTLRRSIALETPRAVAQVIQ